MGDARNDEKYGLGRRLAVLRATHGLDQQALAQLARIDASSLSRIEQGKRTPEPETRSRLLEALRGSDSDLERAAWLIAGVTEDAEGRAASERAVISLGFAVEDRARARLAQRAAPVSPVAEDWSDLWTLEVEDLRAVIEDTPELQTSDFWEFLCGESEKVARANAQRAVALAELALDMAEWVPLVDEAQRPAYRGFALAYHGNALRVQGQLPRAEQAFLQSDAQWQAGAPAGTALDGTRRIDLRASLLFDRRHVSEALGLLDEALELGPKGPAARARIFIKKAKLHEELKQHAVALEFLKQAEPLLAQEPEPMLVYSHRTLVVGNLRLAGYAEEAERRLGEVQALAAELGNELDQLRLLWLEAWIDVALGRRLAAIEKMRGVRAEFQARQIPYDTALATLELAALLLEQGETAEVKELAVEMLETFTEQGVPQEAEKALRIFCEAAVQETATVELVRRVLGEVGRG